MISSFGLLYEDDSKLYQTINSTDDAELQEKITLQTIYFGCIVSSRNKLVLLSCLKV